MSLIERTEHPHGVIQLSLNNGGGNALSSALLNELEAAVTELEGARALVLDGGSAKLFSGGFDLTEIVDFERADLAEQKSQLVEEVSELSGMLKELEDTLLYELANSTVCGWPLRARAHAAILLQA